MITKPFNPWKHCRLYTKVSAAQTKSPTLWLKLPLRTGQPDYLFPEQAGVCSRHHLSLGSLLGKSRFNYIKFKVKQNLTHLVILIYSAGYQWDWAYGLQFGFSILFVILF